MESINYTEVKSSITQQDILRIMEDLCKKSNNDQYVNNFVIHLNEDAMIEFDKQMKILCKKTTKKAKKDHTSNSAKKASKGSKNYTKKQSKKKAQR